MNITAFVAFQLDLQDRIRSAALTLQRLPNDDHRFLHAADRCSWPSFVQDWHAYGAANARPPRLHPAPEAIDSMHDVIGWMAWLAGQDRDEAKVVWLCFGLAHKSSSAAKLVGCHRRTIIRLRKAGLERLAHHLLTEQKKAA